MSDQGIAAQIVVHNLPVDKVHPNPHQPRRHFDEARLRELAASIKASGVHQPILVRQIGPEHWELIMGERRLRASKLAQKETIPALVVEADDERSAAQALVENMQREDLTPIEEAHALAALVDRHSGDIHAVAFQVSKSVAFVKDRLALLKLTQPVQEMLERQEITLEQAKILLEIADPTEQLKAAQLARDLKLSANQLKGRTQHVRKPDGEVGRQKLVTLKRLRGAILGLHDMAENFVVPAKFKSEEREMLGSQVEILKEALDDLKGRLGQAPDEKADDTPDDGAKPEADDEDAATSAEAGEEAEGVE